MHKARRREEREERNLLNVALLDKKRSLKLIGMTWNDSSYMQRYYYDFQQNNI